MKKLKDILKTKKTVKVESLRKWNFAMAGLHFVSAMLILVLSKNSTLPVTTNYLTLDPITSQSGQPVLVNATKQIGNLNLAIIMVAFLLMSAAAHLIIATIYRKRYEADLKLGINKARWIEYSLSASTMIVAIALLTGIYDLSSLVMLFALVAVMNLCGLIMEIHNQTTKKTNWISFIVGCIDGIVPWIVLLIYFYGANSYGAGQIPTFVYWIYVSIFIFFNCFAVNMYLQYKKTGKWANYLYGEKVYMTLSLVAKSALAWQIFAGTLRP